MVRVMQIPLPDDAQQGIVAFSFRGQVASQVFALGLEAYAEIGTALLAIVAKDRGEAAPVATDPIDVIAILLAKLEYGRRSSWSPLSDATKEFYRGKARMLLSGATTVAGITTEEFIG